tara:strand:+ start:1810 stop:3639 length:1830 start_codon:yes stop_codon:yes gene_type:complete
MATKTTGGSLYSGLLQTNQELAKARELEANALSIGLEQGVKPLQQTLLAQAQEEQKRLDKLDLDQANATEYMQLMSDTSGLLGEYEPLMTQLAKETKFKLNEIATDESLNTFEKAAAYKEAVDSFNKTASTFGRDQEIAANLNKAIIEGNISGSVDVNGEDYKIASAIATGKFKVTRNGYQIEGVDGLVNSQKLRSIILDKRELDPDKFSGTIAGIGAATTNAKDLERDLRVFAAKFGTIKSAQQALIDGLGLKLNDISNLTTLEQLQDEIVKRSNTIAQRGFIEAKPPVIQPSSSDIMGRQSYNLVQNSIDTGNYNIYSGGEIGGETISNAAINPETGLIEFDVFDNKGKLIRSQTKLNPRDPADRIALGTILINQTKTTPTVAGDALGVLRNLYMTPTETTNPKGDPKEDPTTTTGLPEYFNTFNINVPNQLKNEDGEVIKSKSKEDSYVRNVLNVTGSRSMGSAGFKVAELVRSDYNGVFSEANIRKAAYELNYEGTDSEGRPFGKSDIEAADLAGQSADANQKVALLAIDSANEQNIDLDTRNELRNKLSDIQEALNTNKSLVELTNKDIAIYNYIKAGGQLSNYETALADLKKEKDDNLNTLEV